MKLGIIRCSQTEEACPGSSCFKFIKERRGAFENITEDIDIVGFVSCGGCCGKRAAFRAKELVRRGADTIAFTTCITRGTPIGYICPFSEKIIETVKACIGGNIKILEFTH